MNNFSAIFSPVSQDAPCGENVYEDMGYEIQFAGLVNAGLGIAVDTFVESRKDAAAPPSRQTAWKELEEQLEDLFRQTRHADMLYLLTLTEAHLHGIPGLIEGIDATNTILNGFWKDLHPDQSEADYEYRRDCLKKLDADVFAECLNAMTIADGRQLGKFTLTDWIKAKRADSADLKTIEQAMEETRRDQPSFYDEIVSGLKELNESLDRLALTIKDKFVSFRLTFTPLRAKIAEIAQLLGGLSGGGSMEEQENEAPGSAADPSQPAPVASYQINSREDVLATLASIMLYYSKNEVTSPVPLLVNRAQRVASMRFRDVVQEFNLSGFIAVSLDGVEAEAAAGDGSDIPQPVPGVPGRINSRDDVVKALARIIQHYDRNDSTSPVPSLLERAQRVATMTFKEVIQEFNLTGTPSIPEVLGWKKQA